MMPSWHPELGLLAPDFHRTHSTRKLHGFGGLRALCPGHPQGCLQGTQTTPLAYQSEWSLQVLPRSMQGHRALGGRGEGGGIITGTSVPGPSWALTVCLLLCWLKHISRAEQRVSMAVRGTVAAPELAHFFPGVPPPPQSLFPASLLPQQLGKNRKKRRETAAHGHLHGAARESGGRGWGIENGEPGEDGG